VVKQISPKDVPFFSSPATDRRGQGRIVNGNAAALLQFPYQVSIRSISKSTASICGGSIISKEFILTAAHCTKGYLSFEIGFGTNLLSGPLFRVTAFNRFEHPKFNENLLSNVKAKYLLSEQL
jgi:hypothetical protein